MDFQDLAGEEIVKISETSSGLIGALILYLWDELVKKPKLFEQTNEWSQWSMINCQITKLFKKRKEVNTPSLWLVHRKELLGIA
jgi:hypothetical protein